MLLAGRLRGGLGAVGGFVALLAVGTPAAAQVTQTDAAATPLPQPVPQAEATLVNDSWAWNANTQINRDPSGANLNPAVRYGDFYSPPTYPQFVTGDAVNLSGLFKWRREAIDPVKDAKIGPGYFSAKCGFTVELLLLSGNCQAQFGWYNIADPTSKTPPAAGEIYPVMTGKPQNVLNCVEMDGKTRKTDGFCPLAWDNKHPYDLSIKRWTPTVFPSGDISKDPHYKGGYVGFAMIGDPNKCASNRFSMYEHNERNASGVPWVTTLIYQSTVDPGGFYFAFEDQSMSAADWKKTTAGYSGADGDFNDLVYYVSGLTCAGGNLSCDTGLQGACAVGRTACAPEGQTPACQPVKQPSAESCDNIDNDCNGLVDDGDGLCVSGKVCFHGACVASCKTGEFPCPTGTTCEDSGRCVEPSCAALSCPSGSVCRAGACVDKPCAGILCPYGRQCELGVCVDPCAGVNCPADRVCEQGLCLAKCDCWGCDTGLTCGNDGRCTDAACAGTMCDAGLTCRAGACVDPCAGVVCPSGGLCSNGVCSKPHTGNGGQGGAGPISFGGGFSFGGSSAFGGRSAEVEQAGAAGADEGGAAGAGDSGNAGGNAAIGGGRAHAGGSANAQGGTIARGGTGPQAHPSDESSSSCGFTVPGQGAERRALPLLGLILGGAFMRRRSARARRASSP